MRVPLALLLLLAAGTALPSRALAAEIRGTLAPRGAEALPAGAEVSVSLRETAGQGRLGRSVAEQRFRVQGGAAPQGFVLEYSPSAVQDGAGYAIAVRVMHQGRLAWLNVDRVAFDPRSPARPLAVPLVAAEPASAPPPVAVARKSVPAPAAQAAGEPEASRVAVARDVPAVARAPAGPPLVQAAAPAAPDQPAADVAPDALRCQGNEPGWLLISHAGQVRLRTQDSPGREINMPARYTSAPWAETPFGVLRGEAPGSGTLVAFLTAERCGDTMSEAVFPMRARVSMPDGSVRAGCCRPVHAQSDPRRPDDWSRHLADLLPVVQACTVARPGTVLAAWPMNQGKAGVRIASGDGNRFDCIADLGSRRAERIATVAPNDRLPGEGRPVLRVGLPARAEACRVVEPVRGQDGTLVGSLAWEACP